MAKKRTDMQEPVKEWKGGTPSPRRRGSAWDRLWDWLLDEEEAWQDEQRGDLDASLDKRAA